MGSLCCSKKNQEILSATTAEIEKEKEIEIKQYTSVQDKDFQKIEHQYNYLRRIIFTEYMYSLVNFSLENAVLPDDYAKSTTKYNYKNDFYKSEFPIEFFQSFLDNKILKHPKVYSKAGNQEDGTNIFKETFTFVHQSLSQKLLQNHNKNNKNLEENENVKNIFKKSYAINFGLLYCSGLNIVKIKTFYNLFSNENEMLFKSDELSDFLLSLFLIPSYCMLFARGKVGNKIPGLGEFTKATAKEYIDFSELKDCENLVNITNERIFGENDTISYGVFKGKFVDEDNSKNISYIFSPKGIRFMLKENNV